VTLQSFLWSSKAEEKHTELNPIRQQSNGLLPSTDIHVYDIFVARPDLIASFQHKTSDKQVVHSTHSLVKMIVIGEVQDRGGRVEERRIDTRTSVGIFKPRIESQPKSQRSDVGKGHRVKGGWTNDTPQERDSNKSAGRGGGRGWGGKRGRGQGGHYT